MKKDPLRLRLHRETLHHLESMAVQGGAKTNTCASFPCGSISDCVACPSEAGTRC